MAKRRRAWAWLPAIAFAVAAIALLARGPESDAPAEGEIEREEERQRLDPLPPSREEVQAVAARPSLKGAPPAPARAPANPGPFPVVGESAGGVRPAGAAAVLRIALDLPQAWRGVEGWAYALPAGAPGVDQPDGIPHRKTKGEGALELALPVAGLWDIGYASHIGQALVEDVEVPGTRDLVITARGAAPLTFRMEGASAGGAGAPSEVVLRVRLPDDALEVNFPGRGERRGIRPPRVTLTEGVVARTTPLPRGVPFAVRLPLSRLAAARAGKPTRSFEADRAVAYAGDEVVLRRVHLGLVRVHLALRGVLPQSWTSRWTGNMWTAVRATPIGETRLSFASTWLTKAGALQNNPLSMALAPGRYQLDAGIGRSFVTDTRHVRVEPGATVDVEADLIPDPSFVPGVGRRPDGEQATHAFLRIHGATEGRLHVVCPVQGEDGEVWWGCVRDDLPLDRAVELVERRRVPRAQALVYPDRASEIFDVPATGEVSVTLRPAGSLVVVPEVDPHPSLGGLRIRGKDGWAIPYLADESRPELEAEPEVEAKPGRVIGPFPPGRRRFEILLGGVVVGEASATVRAGRLDPLHLRWLK